MIRYRAMVVTDLDGTLFQRQHRVSEANLQTLRRLGRERVLRVIATGRNLYSARKVLAADFPVDFVIFSTGAGIMDWPAQRLVRAVSMRPGDLARAFRLLRGRRLDFMVHRPVPENHFFVYFGSGRDNPDFQSRLDIYREFATPGRDGVLPMHRASQLLAIEPVPGAGPAPAPRWGGPAGTGEAPAEESTATREESTATREESAATGEPPPHWDPPPPARPLALSLFESLRRDLPGLNVVRTTSPLDGRSRWIEIFPPRVLKSLAAAWVAGRCGIRREAVLALGNDFNDFDLLEWAPHAFLVGGAAPELVGHFAQVCTGGEEDFSAAVTQWQRGLPLPHRMHPGSGGSAAGS